MLRSEYRISAWNLKGIDNLEDLAVGGKYFDNWV
jgi:hypothetical protein